MGDGGDDPVERRDEVDRSDEARERRRASRKSRVEPLSIDRNGSADVEPTTPKKKKKKKPAQLSTDALMPTSTDALMTPSTEALDSAYEPTSPSTPTTDHQAALAARRARLASRSSQGMIEVPIEERAAAKVELAKVELAIEPSGPTALEQHLQAMYSHRRILDSSKDGPKDDDRSFKTFTRLLFDFGDANEMPMTPVPGTFISLTDGNRTPTNTLPRKGPAAQRTLKRSTSTYGNSNASSMYGEGRPGDIPVEKEMNPWHYGHRGVMSYLGIILLLLCVSLGYTLLDIVISHQFNSNVSAGVGIFDTTIGIISTSFDFLWKYLSCIYVYPLAMQKSNGKYNWKKIIIFGILGCCYHMACLAIVRGPVAAAGGFVYTAPGTIIAGGVFRIILTFALDFVAMPFLFRREHNRLAPEEFRLKRSKRCSIAFLTYVWMSAWIAVLLIDYYAAADYSAVGLAMDLILWLPLIALFVVMVKDRPVASIASTNYLVFYLFVLYLLPYFTGSVLNLFRAMNVAGVRFLITIAYIAIFQVMFSIVVGIARNMTHARTYVIFLFLQQFFDIFFGTLFFVDSSLSSYFLPWLILAAQSGWIIIRSSGITKDMMIFALFKSEPYLKQFSLFRFVSNTTIETGEARLVHQVMLASQYTICDCISIISVPIQYYYYTSTLPASELAAYALNYNMTPEQHYAGDLAIRFAIIGGVKLFAYVVAYVLLYFKIRQYNRECIKYGRDPINVTRTLVVHLTRNSVFLIIMCIEVMRLSYFMLSALLFSSSVPLAADPRGKFWFVVSYLTIGYRS